MVSIRPYRVSDYDVVRRWIDRPEARGPYPPYTPARSDAEVRALVSGEDASGVTRFGIEVDGRLIGEVQHWGRERGNPPGVLGMGVVVWDPADRGHGYGREAQRQVVDLAFRSQAAHRVEAGTHPDNVPERRCLESLGFSEEGLLRDYFGTGDGRGDLVMYGLLRREWEGMTEGND